MGKSSMIISGFMILFIFVFFYLVYLGFNISNEQREDCIAKGGYALMERGAFKDCLKGVESIK